MKKIIITLFIMNLNMANSFDNFDIRELVDDGKLFKDAYEIVHQVGLNCATDPKFVPYFLKEFWRVLSGVSRVIAESSQILLYKKDYPNLCHVMTQNHIDSYSEGEDIENFKKCVLKEPITGKCITHKRIKKERPKPSYYWPLYFIEVTEKGNDSHAKFAKNNLLYSANRKIAKLLEKYIDEAGAVKLTSLVMGGANALNSVGMKVNKGDLSEIMKISALTPFEKMRIRANKKDDMRSFDVSIWPVAMGELFARHFSVCGPILEQRGQRPGGYSWSLKGVPMTCPVAFTNDAYAFWDTGMLDYLDPEALSAMATGSNPASCGLAQGAALLSSLNYSKGSSAGKKSEINNLTSSLSGHLKKGIKSCSFPVLGEAHGIAKQALSLASSDKWKQAKCTLWGSLSPRMSTSVYENDYSYANTALKFKLLAHDLFSVPRGKEEKWSLAYPWENSKNFLSGQFSDYFNELGNALKKLNINLPKNNNKGRSYTMFTPGSPFLVDMSFTPKYVSNVSKNWGKEILYLSGLAAASLKARKEMEKRFKETVKISPLKEEIIWKKRSWCESHGQRFQVKSDKECINIFRRSISMTYREEMFKSGIRKVKSPSIKKFTTKCKDKYETSHASGEYTQTHHRKICTVKLLSEKRIPIETINLPTEDPRSITKRQETRQLMSNAAAATPWVGAEIARNSLSLMTGNNPVKGDRRIYTIFEKINCSYPSTRITTKVGFAPEIRKYESCESAIRYEVYKYIQTKFLRKICNAFGQKEGKPWK